MTPPDSAPPFELLGLDHLVLRARDPQRLVRFYADVLGCPLERTVESIGLWQLRAGRSLVDIIDVAGELGRPGGFGPGAEGRNVDHLCLRVEPFDAPALDAWLADHRVDADAPARRYGADGYGHSIYLRDPEGNTVELKGPPEAPSAA